MKLIVFYQVSFFPPKKLKTLSKVHVYEQQYKKGSGPSIFKGQQVEFFWEISPFDDEDKNESKIDATDKTQLGTYFLQAPVTNNETKVSWVIVHFSFPSSYL